jgi:type IV secretion system protein VirB5
MKKLFLGLALSACVAAPAFAQMSVNINSDIPATIHQGQIMAQWASQYGQMATQIEQLRQQYTSLNGSRGLGTILNNPALRNYLPADWQKVYDSVRAGGYAGLSGSGKAVYDASKIFDACTYITDAAQRGACQARAVKPSQDKAFAMDAYEAARSRIDQIDGLMSKINETQDPKAIAELQARIASEQANIQNEQTKLQLYAMMAQAEDRVQTQRQRELNARTWSATKGIKVNPLTF